MSEETISADGWGLVISDLRYNTVAFTKQHPEGKEETTYSVKEPLVKQALDAILDYEADDDVIEAFENYDHAECKGQSYLVAADLEGRLYLYAPSMLPFSSAPRRSKDQIAADLRQAWHSILGQALKSVTGKHFNRNIFDSQFATDFPAQDFADWLEEIHDGGVC